MKIIKMEPVMKLFSETKSQLGPNNLNDLKFQDLILAMLLWSFGQSTKKKPKHTAKQEI